jgi:hypothetical protein
MVARVLELHWSMNRLHADAEAAALAEEAARQRAQEIAAAYQAWKCISCRRFERY